MSLYNREDEYIKLLSVRDHSVKELSEKLFISEPTVRRDIVIMKEKNLVSSKRGVVHLEAGSPDRRIPMFIRDLENRDQKMIIAKKAAEHIRDGNVIMLDASTSAYCLLSYLGEFKNLFVITSGAKTAITLATMGIRTLCIGGEMAIESFSFIGTDAEETLSKYNADIAFVSCRGLSDDGNATDTSINENSIRKIMIKNSAKSYLLCDKSKMGNKYLNTLCNVKELDGVITD